MIFATRQQADLAADLLLFALREAKELDACDAHFGEDADQVLPDTGMRRSACLEAKQGRAHNTRSTNYGWPDYDKWDGRRGRWNRREWRNRSRARFTRHSIRYMEAA